MVVSGGPLGSATALFRLITEFEPALRRSVIAHREPLHVRVDGTVAQ
jgi:hypothetical protein